MTSSVATFAQASSRSRLTTPYRMSTGSRLSSSRSVRRSSAKRPTPALSAGWSAASAALSTSRSRLARSMRGAGREACDEPVAAVPAAGPAGPAQSAGSAAPRDSRPAKPAARRRRCTRFRSSVTAPSDDARVATERRPPEALAEEHDRARRAPLVVGGEEATGDGSDAEHLEQVRRDDRPPRSLRGSPAPVKSTVATDAAATASNERVRPCTRAQFLEGDAPPVLAAGRRRGEDATSREPSANGSGRIR